MRDRLAAFLYWAAHWLERAADRVWYGRAAATIERRTIATIDASGMRRR